MFVQEGKLIGNTNKTCESMSYSLKSIPTDTRPSVSYIELQNIYYILPHSPTSIPTATRPLVSYRDLQNIYCILPPSLTDIPTTTLPSIFYRELQSIYCNCHNHWQTYRRHLRCTLQIPIPATIRVLGQSVHLPTDSPMDFEIPMHACFDTSIPMELPTDNENLGGISKTFGAKFKIYQRNLMPPPTKILF